MLPKTKISYKTIKKCRRLDEFFVEEDEDKNNGGNI